MRPKILEMRRCSRGCVLETHAYRRKLEYRLLVDRLQWKLSYDKSRKNATKP